MTHDQRISGYELESWKNEEWSRANGVVVDMLHYSQNQLDTDLELLERIGYDHNIFLRTAVAQLRASALLYRHFTEGDPSDLMKERLVFTIAKMYDAHDITIPRLLSFLLNEEEMRELKEEKYEQEGGVEEVIGQLKNWQVSSVNKEIDAGVNTRIAERRGEVKSARIEDGAGEIIDEDAAGVNIGLNTLLAVYPDPKVLVDRLLELKDGRLPL